MCFYFYFLNFHFLFIILLLYNPHFLLRFDYNTLFFLLYFSHSSKTKKELTNQKSNCIAHTKRGRSSLFFFPFE